MCSAVLTPFLLDGFSRSCLCVTTCPLLKPTAMPVALVAPNLAGLGIVERGTDSRDEREQRCGRVQRQTVCGTVGCRKRMARWRRLVGRVDVLM